VLSEPSAPGEGRAGRRRRRCGASSEEREQLASTAIGDGIAIPHGKLDSSGW
jgi:hypothetical protein